jgi:N-acetylglucosaminyl-diphospho-decaprenol L-rhamnosyltransferase
MHRDGAMKKPTKLVVSIVSHGQGSLVKNLLHHIEEVCDPTLLKVVVTKNIEESFDFEDTDFRYELQVIENESPKGFASNHNFVFEVTGASTFGILNPDITFTADPFAPLLRELTMRNAGIVAPLVTDPADNVEDTARRKITPRRIAERLLRKKQPDYFIGTAPVSPEWVAGMFMLFSGKCFSTLGGFDESYRMYCEDADICMRAREKGFRVLLIPSIAVCHAAQRGSHRSIKYCAWHVKSLCRFFRKHNGFVAKGQRAREAANGLPSANT